MVGLALLVRPVAAQIVNVQGQLAQPPAADGVSGQLELKVDWRAGNTSLLVLGGAGSLMWRRGKLLGLATARGEYGNARGLAIARKSFEHVRARYALDDRWKWEAFAQHEYDAFRRLSIRAVAGTGPALQLSEGDDIALLAGAAYLFELEDLDKRAGTIDAGLRTTHHRASLYLTGSEKLGEGVAFVQTIYVQPRIDEPSDLRLLGELSVTSKLTRRIALSNALTATYDRSPPDTVERYDVTLKLSLLISL